VQRQLVQQGASVQTQVQKEQQEQQERRQQEQQERQEQQGQLSHRLLHQVLLTASQRHIPSMHWLPQGPHH
jgi:hypothetical protein